MSKIYVKIILIVIAVLFFGKTIADEIIFLAEKRKVDSIVTSSKSKQYLLRVQQDRNNSQKVFVFIWSDAMQNYKEVISMIINEDNIVSAHVFNNGGIALLEVSDSNGEELIHLYDIKGKLVESFNYERYAQFQKKEGHPKTSWICDYDDSLMYDSDGIEFIDVAGENLYIDGVDGSISKVGVNSGCK